MGRRQRPVPKVVALDAHHAPLERMDHWATPNMAAPLTPAEEARLTQRATSGDLATAGARIHLGDDDSSPATTKLTIAFAAAGTAANVALLVGARLGAVQGASSFALLAAGVATAVLTIISGSVALRAIRCTGGVRKGGGITLACLLGAYGTTIFIAAFAAMAAFDAQMRATVLEAVGAATSTT